MHCSLLCGTARVECGGVHLLESLEFEGKGERDAHLTDASTFGYSKAITWRRALKGSALAIGPRCIVKRAKRLVAITVIRIMSRGDMNEVHGIYSNQRHGRWQMLCTSCFAASQRMAVRDTEGITTIIQSCRGTMPGLGAVRKRETRR